jgi:hypothetical protein
MKETFTALRMQWTLEQGRLRASWCRQTLPWTPLVHPRQVESTETFSVDSVAGHENHAPKQRAGGLRR